MVNFRTEGKKTCQRGRFFRSYQDRTHQADCRLNIIISTWLDWSWFKAGYFAFPGAHRMDQINPKSDFIIVLALVGPGSDPYREQMETRFLFCQSTGAGNSIIRKG
jgi:hypothetical protein